MGKVDSIHYPIDPFLFRMELEANCISIRSLGDKNSPNYIGLSDKTIFRALKQKWVTKETLDKLSEIVEVDNFIMDMNWEDEIRLLQKENAELRKALEDIRKILDRRLQ